MNYAALIFAIFCVSAGQIVTKARLNIHGEMPMNKAFFQYVWGLMLDPMMWFVGFLTAIGGISWYYALSRLPVSTAVVFAAFVYPIVTFSGYFFLNETVSGWAILGVALITIGIVMVGWSSSFASPTDFNAQ